jgi:hypothetical protein
MATAFTITTASTTVPLDRARTGEATFAVTNSAGRPLRGRAKVHVGAPEVAGYFSIDGEAERPFDVNATEQYRVRIAVPPDAPAGDITFTVTVLDQEAPDDFHGQGPMVSVVVPGAPAPTPKVAAGYLVTFAGTVAGAVSCGAAGLLIGVLVVWLFSLFGSSPGGLSEFIGEAIGLLLLVALLLLLGLWLGGAAGSWMALRLRRYPGPLPTAAMVLALLPVWGVVTAWLLLRGDPGSFRVVLFFAVTLGLPPLAARAVYLWRSKRPVLPALPRLPKLPKLPRLPRFIKRSG